MQNKLYGMLKISKITLKWTSSQFWISTYLYTHKTDLWLTSEQLLKKPRKCNNV